MKIAIIGASGEVGFRLVQKLCLNYQLICIVRDKKKKDFSKLSNIALFEKKNMVIILNTTTGYF